MLNSVINLGRVQVQRQCGIRRFHSKFMKNGTNLSPQMNRIRVVPMTSMMGGNSKRFYNDRLDSSKIEIELTKNPKTKSPYNQLQFGREFSDHMLEMDWNSKDGWLNPVIRPYSNFSIDPAASVFHYALEAFEGLKAYRDKDNKIRLFRPDMNAKRLNKSCEALVFPKVDEIEYQKCLNKLLKIEKEWIPNVDLYSLYIRPTVISTYPYIGVGASEAIKLYVILSPVGPYYPEGFAAVTLWATDEYVRAWPHGVGGYKLGSNYGPTIRAQKEAANKGYSQVMWLHENEKDGRHKIEEVGTMNQFIFWINEQTGKEELVTPPLEGTILPGVTRNSVLALTREWKEFDVSERAVYMDEIVKASKEGRIIEAFGAGTAAIISTVKKIGYKNEDIIIPLDPNDPTQEAGPLARRLFQTILDIQYGRTPHEWSVIVDENE